MIPIDPLELLPCHKHLLQQDYISLGEGSYVDSQYLLAQCDSAHTTALSHCSQDKHRLYSSEPPDCRSVRSIILLKNMQVTSSPLGLSWDRVCPLSYEARNADFCCMTFNSVALLHQIRNTSVHDSSIYKLTFFDILADIWCIHVWPWVNQYYSTESVQ